MPRKVFHTKLKSHLLVDLERCFAFKDLSPEQLNTISKYCTSIEIELEQARRPLEFNNKIILIAEGLFEITYYPDKKATDDPNMAVVLNGLKPGDLFGYNSLYPSNSTTINKIKIRCTGKGRIIKISCQTFEKFLNKWPFLQEKLLKDIAGRAFDYSIDLGKALDKLYNTDIVLDRIESVATLMMDTMTGTGEQKEVNQKKFLLKKLPAFNDMTIDTIKIEQIYLSSSTSDKEDRIRKTTTDNSDSYLRTTKFGSGQNRKVFTRQIYFREYIELKGKQEGSTIIKDRIKIEEIISQGKIVFDIFHGELDGLILCEVDIEKHIPDSEFVLPDFISQCMIREVTEDRNYTNRSLSINGLPV